MGRRLQTYEKLPGGHLLNNGRFKIVRSINAGGFGIGYEADQIQGLFRKVFIKEHFPKDYVMREQGDITVALWGSEVDYEWSLNQFLEEGQLLASLRKEKGLVTIFETFEENGTAYMVMEYVDGVDLKTWLAERHQRGQGAPSEAEILEILFPLLDGLSVAHEGILDRETGRMQPIIHRDIASDNIRLRQEDGSPVLLDFGSARPSSDDLLTVAVTAVVKRGYAPWELYQTTDKWQGPWTDIYSLGALIHEMITGTLPIEGHERKVSDVHLPLSEQLDLREKGYSEKFLNSVDCALLVDETKRPQSIAEWRAELQPEIVEFKKPKMAVALWSLVALAVVIGAAVGFLLLKEPPEQTIVVTPGTEDTARGNKDLEAVFERARTGRDEDLENLRVHLTNWKVTKPDIQSEELLNERLALIDEVSTANLIQFEKGFYEDLKVQFTKNFRIQEELKGALKAATTEDTLDDQITSLVSVITKYGEWSNAPAREFGKLMKEAQEGIGSRTLEQSDQILKTLNNARVRIDLQSLEETLKLVGSENILKQPEKSDDFEKELGMKKMLFSLVARAEAEQILQKAEFENKIDTSLYTSKLNQLSERLSDVDIRDRELNDFDVEEIQKRMFSQQPKFAISQSLNRFQSEIESDLQILEKINQGIAQVRKEQPEVQAGLTRVLFLESYAPIVEVLFREFVSGTMGKNEFNEKYSAKNPAYKNAVSEIKRALNEWEQLFEQLYEQQLSLNGRTRGRGLIDQEINQFAGSLLDVVSSSSLTQERFMLVLNFDEGLRELLMKLGNSGCDEDAGQCHTINCFMVVAEGSIVADWTAVEKAARKAWEFRLPSGSTRAGELLTSALVRMGKGDREDVWNHWMVLCQVASDVLSKTDDEPKVQKKIIREVFSFVDHNYEEIWPLIASKGVAGFAGGKPDFTVLIDQYFNLSITESEEEFFSGGIQDSLTHLNILYQDNRFGVVENPSKFLEYVDLILNLLEKRDLNTETQDLYRQCVYDKVSTLKIIIDREKDEKLREKVMMNLVAVCDKGKQWHDSYLGIVGYYYRFFLPGVNFSQGDRDEISKMTEKLIARNGVTEEMVLEAQECSKILLKK